MTETIQFLTPGELSVLADRCLQPNDDDAQTLPLPFRFENSLRIIILFYREVMAPDVEISYPPRHRIEIDPVSGDILANISCKPKDFERDQDPEEPVEGFGLPEDLSPEEYWRLKDLFFDLSPLVWRLYLQGSRPVEEEDLQALNTYVYALQRISKAPLVPYYESIAEDFILWLSDVLSE